MICQLLPPVLCNVCFDPSKVSGFADSCTFQQSGFPCKALKSSASKSISKQYCTLHASVLVLQPPTMQTAALPRVHWPLVAVSHRGTACPCSACQLRGQSAESFPSSFHAFAGLSSSSRANGGCVCAACCNRKPAVLGSRPAYAVKPGDQGGWPLRLCLHCRC